MKRFFGKVTAGILAAVMALGTVGGTQVKAAESVSITDAGGWNEMLYVQLSGLTDSDVTGVSYSGEISGSLTGEDLAYLVRDNNDGVRIDIPGLKAGTYSVTIQSDKGNVSKNDIVVGAQDRSGYAHYNSLEGVGAYNNDGTLKDNTIVLYVTDENKNTVSVTSKDGTTVQGIGHILNSAGKGSGSASNNNQGIIKKLAGDGTPLVVRIIGNVTAPDGLTAYDSTDFGGSVGDNGFMARMQSGKDVTIEGIGYDATINGWGIHFIAESSAPDYGKSFEVRNISFRNVPEDCIGMEGVQKSEELTAPVERCWIHNCEFYAPSIPNPAESDKDGGDGACDFKRGLYFTNSYCYYEGYHKTNLVGASDTNMQYHLTYHHNYWKNCESRGPLARQANIHMYNNVFENQSSYCMNPRANAYIFSEYNVFEGSKNPMRVDLGAIKSYNDVFTNCRGEQDGTIVADKNEKVSCDNAYENFDTDASVSYIPAGNYLLHTDTSELKNLLIAQSGTMKNNSDSGSSDIVVPTAAPTSKPTTAPTSKPTAAPTGEPTTAPTGQPTTAPTQKPVEGTINYVHNFTEDGKNSTFFTITGSLSTSKGTVNYNNLVLEQCLKMESSTSITFTIGTDATLLLVFNGENSTSVKVNGAKYTYVDGIFSMDISAGSYIIEKADVANLFYMAVTNTGEEENPTPAPTVAPTSEPTVAPTSEPTAAPTSKPTAAPTSEPTAVPTSKPTAAPTSEPTAAPTSEPTAAPTSKPTAAPTSEPTTAPTSQPTAAPTSEPTTAPTSQPTAEPTSEPTAAPTSQPTAAPTSEPTAAPTSQPTVAPTSEPTAAPTSQPTAVPTSEPTPAPIRDGWVIIDGKEYWYEDGVLQGTEGRGKEIYDSATDAWYWLDAVQGGAKTVNKDVYQESEAGPWADREDGTGKWVRYDENGHMIKGWQNTEGGKYYFDTTFGTMAKGYATIEGIEYYFDEATGLLVSEIGEVPANGWKVMDGMSYWYENSVRQGFKVNDNYRGKEIYDEASDGWYWLDNVQGGAKAVNKDVYQESYSAYPDRPDGTGKWVRYDEDGRMIKGWQITDAGTYYFEEVTGSMAKGRVTIEGQEYYFDEATGLLQ